MSSIHGPHSGDVLVLRLEDERRSTEELATVPRHRPTARTLLKEGPLRVVLVVLGPGAEMGEHRAEGPITVQPLDGTVRFTALGKHHDLRPGELLSTRAGIRHAVSSATGGAFLLTIALPSWQPRSEPAS